MVNKRRLANVGYCLGFLTCLGGLITVVSTSTRNPHKTPTVSEYHTAITTLDDLKKLKQPDLSYQPEHIKPHLRVLEEYKTSLDTTIKLIEKDIEEMRNSKELKAYKKWELNNLRLGVLIAVVGGFAGFLAVKYKSKLPS